MSSSHSQYCLWNASNTAPIPKGTKHCSLTKVIGNLLSTYVLHQRGLLGVNKHKANYLQGKQKAPSLPASPLPSSIQSGKAAIGMWHQMHPLSSYCTPGPTQNPRYKTGNKGTSPCFLGELTILDGIGHNSTSNFWS